MTLLSTPFINITVGADGEFLLIGAELLFVGAAPLFIGGV